MAKTKTDRTVVRNAAYKRGGLNKRERHNERKNADYMNDDIIPERAAFNVHFKQAEGGYEQAFDKMLADGLISTKGLPKDPNIVDELIFDVNTAYFEQMGKEKGIGGYEYAKSFFEEAYRMAVGEIGGEQFVLSAVMHADERNKALSEQLGRDVYHYHLHVVYVPVVQKEVYFRKNNKNPELAGKLKEVITQVSHSKKWPRFKDDKGWVNSYSLLQDRFYEHMKTAGFEGFERGERGSTAEHLSVLEYKTQQETKRLADKTAKLDTATNNLATANERIKQANEKITSANNQLVTLGNKIKAVKGEVLNIQQIEKIPVKIAKPMFGGANSETVTIPKTDWDNVKKTALTQAYKDEEYSTALSDAATLKKEKSAWSKERQGFVNKVAQLEKSVKGDFLARAKVDADLYNLRNDVAKIPREVWSAYTKAKSQQHNRGEERS